VQTVFRKKRIPTGAPGLPNQMPAIGQILNPDRISERRLGNAATWLFGAIES
jgi:hypothetical protein